MGLAETAQLTARLDLGGNFLSQAGKINRSLTGLDRSMARSGDRAYKAGAQVGTGIRNASLLAAGAVGLLATQVGAGLRSLVELERLGAQTAAVIKSTGGAAGVTAGQVRVLAEKMESLNATIDDKVIQNTENLLLTFTSIRKNAFEPTLKAILDMNAALGGGEQGLQSVTIQVGKAMQDPIRGLTALRRVGVNFTKDQEKQIKALVKTGDVMGAQKIILAELNREFGGSFLAQGDTTAGKVAKFKDAIEDLQKALATALLPAIGKVSDRLSAFLAKPATIKAISDLGAKIGALFSDANIDKGAGLLRGAFETIRGVLPALKDAAAVSGQVLSTAVSLFRSLPPELQKLAIGALAVNKLTGGLVTNIAGGLLEFGLKNLRTITAANVTVIGGSVTGGVPGVAGKGGGVGVTSRLGAAVRILGTVALAAGSIALIGELLDQKKQQTAQNVELGKGLNQQAEQFGGTASLADLKSSLAGINEYTGKLQRELTPEAIAYQLNIDGVRDAVNETKATIQRSIASAEKAIERAKGLSPEDRDVLSAQTRATDRVYDAIERNRIARQAINVYVTTNVTANAVTKAQQQTFRVGNSARLGVQ